MRVIAEVLFGLSLGYLPANKKTRPPGATPPQKEMWEILLHYQSEPH